MKRLLFLLLVGLAIPSPLNAADSKYFVLGSGLVWFWHL
tara:strand:- start:408 stop:524 length:117 start_codon:yes stop_codon:yes gene_type:complete